MIVVIASGGALEVGFGAELVTGTIHNVPPETEDEVEIGGEVEEEDARGGDGFVEVDSGDEVDAEAEIDVEIGKAVEVVDAGRDDVWFDCSRSRRTWVCESA